MGSHDLNPVLPWEQVLRRSPGKRISDNAVRVMVRFSPSLDYLNIAGSKSVVSCHLNATVAVKKKFSFHFHFKAVQRCNHYRTIYVLLPFRFVLLNVPFRSLIPFHSFTCVNSNSSQLFLVRYRDMVYSNYKKQRILYFYFQGYKPPTITNFLREEGMSVSRRGVAKFVKCYRQTGEYSSSPWKRQTDQRNSRGEEDSGRADEARR